jgi:hypothetical protein
MALDAIDLVLRMTHIFVGVSWLGGTFLLNFVILPRLQKLTYGTRREFLMMYAKPVANWMTIMGGVSLLAGFLLFGSTYEDFGLLLDFGRARHLVFFLALLITAVAITLGSAVLSPLIKKMAAMLEANPEPPKGPPPAAVIALGKRMQLVGLIVLVLALVIMVLMVLLAGKFFP